MQQPLLIAQMIISTIIITAVLLQAQGTGLGGTWSGGGETYHTRRGVEKIVFWATIVAIVLFTLTAIANLIHA